MSAHATPSPRTGALHAYATACALERVAFAALEADEAGSAQFAAWGAAANTRRLAGRAFQAAGSPAT